MRFEKLHLKDYATLGVAASGFLSLYYAQTAYFLSALFVFVAVIMDFLDGRLARHTGKANAFGRELDSLSDAVAFGAAPAFAALIFAPPGIWSFAYFGSALVFLFAAVIRLARFNAYAHEKKYYGLPSPLAAVALVVLAPVLQAYSAALMLLLAFLMLGEFQMKKP